MTTGDDNPELGSARDQTRANTRKDRPHEPSFYNDLHHTCDQAWAMLARGVADRKTAFHTPTLITTSLGGPAPSARTVVLRGCDPSHNHLRIHTDQRSAKYAELRAFPDCSFHIYDAKSKIQLRLTGLAQLHNQNDVARTAWQISAPPSRACYGQQLSPGIETLDPYPLITPQDMAADTADGFANFTVILIAISQFEWLYLAHKGHRRARFTWDGNRWVGTWLAP